MLRRAIIQSADNLLKENDTFRPTVTKGLRESSCLFYVVVYQVCKKRVGLPSRFCKCPSLRCRTFLSHLHHILIKLFAVEGVKPILSRASCLFGTRNRINTENESITRRHRTSRTAHNISPDLFLCEFHELGLRNFR